MDGADGVRHPEVGAAVVGTLFGEAHRDLVLLHSRRYALDQGRDPSKLCWADKLSIVYEPDWFYLLRARASGELNEYRRQAFNWVGPDKTDREWLLWIKRRFAKAALMESRALAISGHRVSRKQTAKRIYGGIRSVRSAAAKSS